MPTKIFDENEEMNSVLRQISGQLRMHLGNIYYSLEHLAPPELREEDTAADMQAAILYQSWARIKRIADNLESATLLDRPNEIKPELEDIVEFCEDIVQESQHLAKLIGITLEFRCSQVSHVILMDRRWIEAMMLNLLSNALKFTPKGGRVEVNVRVGEEMTEIAVSDTGCGISSDLMPTVFERYRYIKDLELPSHGLGLGLPICRKTAWAHGGSLALTSDEGKGTVVTVSLPNKRGEVTKMQTPIIIVSDGFNRAQVGLSDALPKDAFVIRESDE